MAAPTPTPRVAPTGTMVGNGHGSVMTFSLDTNIELSETKTQPPGFEADAPLDISTSHNTKFRTFVPGRLIKGKPAKVSGRYDPVVFQSLQAIVNIPQTFTHYWPHNGDSVAFFGLIQDVDLAELVENQPPEIVVTIFPTQYDHVGCVEAGPVYTNGTGTSCS